jgi:ferredoxin-NADP reductase
VTSFFFATPAPVAFMAGQHMDVRLVAPDGYTAERSYSIASAPGAAEIELAIERLVGGEVSGFFHEVVEVGDEIELRGPIGYHFVWTPEDGGPVLLVGGGSGVVPFVSMIRHRAERRSDVPMLLLHSARDASDVIFAEELAAQHARRDGFIFAVALTRDRAGVADYHRRIDAAMAAELTERLAAPPRHVFLCGSNGFVEAGSAALIAAGIEMAMIRTERYGG